MGDFAESDRARDDDVTRRPNIEPGTTWALSRRTTRRYFLLNPDQARELERCCCHSLGQSQLASDFPPKTVVQ